MCVVSRSAREAEELIKKALEKGESLPTEERFDSNCITPGILGVKINTLFSVSCSSNSKTDFWLMVIMVRSGDFRTGKFPTFQISILFLLFHLLSIPVISFF